MHAGEVQKLVEAVFEYVRSHIETMPFRKRKWVRTLGKPRVLPASWPMEEIVFLYKGQ